MGNDELGKKAEVKIKEWLDKPEEGCCFDRIPDQMTGFFGSKNICDFILFKYPYFYYIESKATWQDRFDFSMISEYQRTHMFEKSFIYGVRSIVIVLFATYKRAFIFNIVDIQHLLDIGVKSLNIKKFSRWNIPYSEITTVENNRKELLDYTGDLEKLVNNLMIGEDKNEVS